MNWTPEEAAKLLANRVNQPHYIQWVIEKCAERGAPCKRFCEANAFEIQIRNLNAALHEAAGQLNEAAQEISDWGSYASDYFQQKHDLEGCIEAVKKQAEIAEAKSL